MDLDSRRGVTFPLVTTRGGLQFQVSILKGPSGRDMSLRNLYQPGDEPELVEDLWDMLKPMNPERLLGNTPAFNAKFTPAERLTTRIPISRDGMLALWRNKNEPADVGSLPFVGDVSITSAAGCTEVVAAYRQTLLRAHAGRDCALDRKRVKKGRRPPRRHESIANTIMHEFARLHPGSFDPSEVGVWMYASIPPEQFFHLFNDEHYGKWNKAAAAYIKRYGSDGGYENKDGVYLNVPGILRQQFMNLRVGWDRISLDHAYLPDDFPTTRNQLNGKYIVATKRCA